MKIELQTRLLKLKGILNDISHASFSYSQLSKDYQLHNLDDQTAQKVATAYENIINSVKNSIMNYENSNNTH